MGGILAEIKIFKTLEPFILASGSPRRERLLKSVGLDFRVEPSRIEESAIASANHPAQTAQKWACAKAASVSELFAQHWVLGADTIVALDGRIFGKPADPAEAVRMLETLSGRTHEVITGICIKNAQRKYHRSGSVLTRVTFRPLTHAEVESYARTAEPLDKAGAYGIQGIGAYLVKSIEGSYTNVVGLPLCETVDWLLEAGIIRHNPR